MTTLHKPSATDLLMCKVQCILTRREARYCRLQEWHCAAASARPRVHAERSPQTTYSKYSALAHQGCSPKKVFAHNCNRPGKSERANASCTATADVVFWCLLLGGTVSNQPDLGFKEKDSRCKSNEDQGPQYMLVESSCLGKEGGGGGADQT